MNANTCDICGGAGTIDKDGKTYECECSMWKRIAATMPPYILSAKFLPKHLESPLLNGINKSFFITATWADMKAVLKAVIMKNHNKLIRITSDREIKDVFLGTKSKNSLEEDSKVVYNSIEDLMGGGDQRNRSSISPDLVVIRLNELGYKNKAAAGTLDEALICRLDYGRPTWVFSDVNNPFTNHSVAYSNKVWDILSTSMTKVEIPKIVHSPILNPPQPNESFPSANLNVDDVIEDASPVVPRPEAKKTPPRVIRPSEDDDAPIGGLGMYGSGHKKTKKFGRSE